MKSKIVKVILSITMLGVLSACGDPNKVMLENGVAESAVQKRSYQTRAFDTNDKNKTLRNVIATMQDLGFVLKKADETLGSVTGSKFVKNRELKMTVFVRPRNENQLLVRANAEYGLVAIADPVPYQDFFNSLGKSMFLEAHEVDGA